MTCEVFVGHLFLARDVTHSAHLNTRSYAKHVALNEFYDGIIDLADKFAEAYQGRHGLIGRLRPVLGPFAFLPRQRTLADRRQWPTLLPPTG